MQTESVVIETGTGKVSCAAEVERIASFVSTWADMASTTLAVAITQKIGSASSMGVQALKS